MSSNNEMILGEGSVNIVPKTFDISHRLLNKNIRKEKMNLFINRNKSELSKNSLTINDKIIPKRFINILKNIGSNSSTAEISSNNEKIKKVTFSTVRIIRIQNYKQFNKLNSYKFDEKKNNRVKTETCEIY